MNKQIIIGYLGKDPETKTFPSGSTATNFSVAVTEKYKDREGNQQEKTEWFDITAMGKRGEVCAKYLSKGSQVYVEAKRQTKTSEKDGNKKTFYNYYMEEIQFLSTKEKSSDPF